MNDIKLVVPLLVFLAIISIPIHQASAVFPDGTAPVPVATEPQLSPSPQDQATPHLDPVPQDNPAIQKPRAAPEDDPDRAEAHLSQGVALCAAGDFPRAIAEFREALRLRPNLVQARSGLGLALYLMGDVDSAIEEYRATLRLQPDLAQARVNLATALMVKHEWTAARAELQAALNLQPDAVQAHYNLAVVRYTLGDIAGAIEAYRAALRLKPDYADVHYNLGLMLKLTNQEADAAQEFLVAARAGPWLQRGHHPKSEWHSARVYWCGHQSGRGAGQHLAIQQRDRHVSGGVLRRSACSRDVLRHRQRRGGHRNRDLFLLRQ